MTTCIDFLPAIELSFRSSYKWLVLILSFSGENEFHLNNHENLSSLIFDCCGEGNSNLKLRCTLMCISIRIAWKPLALLSKDNKTLKFLCLNYHRSSYLFFSYLELFNVLPSVSHLLTSILDYSKFVEMSIVFSSFFPTQPKIFVFYTVSSINHAKIDCSCSWEDWPQLPGIA